MEEKNISDYFSGIADSRVEGRCLYPLSNILLIAVCVYLTGAVVIIERHSFVKERSDKLVGFLKLPHSAPSADTFEGVFKRLEPFFLQVYLTCYGKDLLKSLNEKQIVLDGKELKGVSSTSRGKGFIY